MLIQLSRARHSRAVVALLSLLCMQAACYTYAPLPAGVQPRTGERVRLRLTADGTTEMARYLGPNVVAAEGALGELRTDGTLVVYVDYVQTLKSGRQPWTGEGAVFFPAQYLSNTEGRTLLKRQSIVAGTALGVALVTIAIIALRSAGAGGGGEQPPPPPP